MLFRAVLRPGLLPAIDARGIEGTSHNLITDPTKIAKLASTNKNDRVLLQIVALSRDGGTDLVAIR